MAFDLPLSPVTLSLIGLLILYGIYGRYTRRPTAFDTLPWAGLSKGPFAQLRAYINLSSARDDLLQAYEKYSMNGQNFVWQPLVTNPVIVVSPCEVPWLLEQPESVLSAMKFFEDRQLGRGLLSNMLLHDPIHEKVIRTDLTRALSWTMDPVLEEVQRTLDESAGLSREWHGVHLWDFATSVYARTSARVFVGPELSSDETFVKHTVDFAGVAVTTGAFLHPFPDFLRPLAGLVFLYPNRKHYNQISKSVLPVLEERRANLERAARDPDFKYDLPIDVLQWMTEVSLKTDRLHNWDNDLIMKRYLATTTAAIHTSAIMTSHILCDLATVPPSRGDVIGQLRDEIRRVRAEECGKPGGGWTKLGLTKLVRLDSAVRESLRRGVLSGVSLGRVVAAPQGVTLEDGTWAPPGSHLGVHSLGTNFLADVYPDPEAYDPFRFSRPREEYEAREKRGEAPAAGGEGSEKVGGEYVQQRNKGAATTSLEYLTFGHGRNACPGRFFAIAEIKLFLIEFLTRYDIQPMQERPKNRWIRDVQIPDLTTVLTVRRRADEDV